MGLKQNTLPYGFGDIKRGERNLITDVVGVRVGHVTLDDGDVKTGVTAILPGDDPFHSKFVAASHVINGFGKSSGLVQIDELGSLETPILLTNTLSVGTVSEGLVRYMLEGYEDIGSTTGSVNPVVCECNDSNLNDIRGLHVKQGHVFEAIAAASEEFTEGAVGAGRGMVCFGLKGGIGSASRLVDIDGTQYTVGALLLTNFGGLSTFRLGGDNIGTRIKAKIDSEKPDDEDKGSVIIVIATDAPLTERQLGRVIRRANIGLARLGSYNGNGSGDVVVGFSTANRIDHYLKEPEENVRRFNENKIDHLFRAVADCVEESVVSSMLHAVDTVGRGGRRFRSLSEFLG